MPAQQENVCGKTYLLDFPTKVEFQNIDYGVGFFRSALPYLGHIHGLKLFGVQLILR